MIGERRGTTCRATLWTSDAHITRVILTEEFYPGTMGLRTNGVDPMPDHLSHSYAAFDGTRLLASGSLPEVALAVKAAGTRGSDPALLIFDDATGRVIDLDLRGSEDEVLARLAPPPQHPDVRPPSLAREAEAPPEGKAPARRGPGRPKLGVVAREVTLLPRHWQWLAQQRGGASAALRRLVDEARRSGGSAQQRRQAQEAAYHFMLAIGGDLPGYEEATRALFADDRSRLEAQLAAWPEDVRAHALHLAFPAPDRADPTSRPQDREDTP